MDKQKVSEEDNKLQTILAPFVVVTYLFILGLFMVILARLGELLLNFLW
jgi:hypothetical protein